MKVPRLLITPGEPAGVGPDIVIKAAQQSWPVELVAITDPIMLAARAKALQLPLTIVETSLEDHSNTAHQAGVLRVHPVPFNTTVVPGKLDKDHAFTVMKTLQLAAHACLEGKAQAVVTGPVHKGIMNDAGIAFTGHTEFFAHTAHVTHTVMLFVVDQIKAALVTTHLPLKEVAHHVTKEKITAVTKILHHHLQTYFKLKEPRILVAGLNPHAGEGGHLGMEEIEVIEPALAAMRAEGLLLDGPLPADTIFTPAVLQRGDAVLGMYHDQLLPVIKYAGFDHAVNVTLGLPFIRTSVDHGTALDLAGTGRASACSLIAAIELAIAIQPSSIG